MAQIFKGRYTAQTDEPFVVFIIGFRINQLWAIHKWLPVGAAMGPMLQTLFRHPEKGFLWGEVFLYGLGVGLIQYWRSFEDLERFARQPSEPHLAAWKRFNQAIGSGGSVGIWHETYLVQANQYECVYGNMPMFGLAHATKHVPATGNRETARLRLGGDNEPAVPSPETPPQK
jgi:hypothetical protein